jgi:branched-chain amino acid transport system permease protein
MSMRPSLRQTGRTAFLWLIRPESRVSQLIRIGLGVIAFFAVVQTIFRLAPSDIVGGIALGSLYGVIGVGIILIYRTNRLINFAAGAIGAIPAIAALLLCVDKHINYLAVLPIAIVGGIGVGALVDVGVMRRFSRSPRLIATVVTIGVAQALAIFAFFIPVWIAGTATTRIPNVPTPWQGFKILNARGEPIVTGNQLAALVTVIGLSALLAAFLRYTRIGVALRASAENSDRAHLLGIPVRQVQTVAWMASGLLASMAIFVQAPLIGIPNDATLGFDTLLYGLAAAVVARMERIGVALLAGMGVGILIFASVARQGDNNLATAMMLVVILAALLLQRGVLSRAYEAGVSTWETVTSFRPVPTELRGLREVNVARAVILVAAVAAAAVPPFVIGAPDLPTLQLLPIYGIVAVSLVVLSGWAGQISLGHFGLVAAGAAAVARPLANHNIDFFAALLLGILAGVAAAFVIGLPALRIQGLYLAVTTLAFGYAMYAYGLNTHYWLGRHLLPTGFRAHIVRPVLYGRFDLENEKTFYFVCVSCLAVAMLAAMSFRRNRSGRVLIGARDNQRAASVYGINVTLARLAAFAVSGGIAGMAGVLLAYKDHDVGRGSFGVQYSILIFLFCVIGGLTSVPWAVWGAVTAEAGVLFTPRIYGHLSSTWVSVIPLLLTGPIFVANMYFYPGGLAERGFADRDRFLRWVARRRNILVPALFVEKGLGFDEAEQKIVEAAEEHVESATAFDQTERTIKCPVCGDVLAVEEAAEHEHLKVRT